MLSLIVENTTLLIAAGGLAVQWGYTMHRLKTLETAIDEMKLELRAEK